MAKEKWLHIIAKTGSYNDLANKPRMTSETTIDDETIIASAKSVKKLNDTINGKANSSHTHTKAQITDMPTTMKNPTALTVQFNGSTNKTYDGSSAQTVNITPSAIGASASNHVHNYAGSASVGGAANSAVKLGDGFTATGTPNTTEKTNIITMINEVFQSASNGKSSIATAITSKGVNATSSDSFTTLANKIKQITTGVDTSDATATADNILSGQTAYVKGSKVTGTMVNNGAKTSSLNAGGSYTIPMGYHNGQGKITANSLASQTQGTASVGDILSGKTAIVNGSKLTGSMVDRSKTGMDYFNSTHPNMTINKGEYPQYNNYGTSNPKPRLAVCPPTGWYPGNGSAYVTMEANEVASAIGLTSDKLISGTSVCGVNGNIPNRGEYQYAGGFGEGGDYYAMNNIPWGFYPNYGGNGWAPEIRFSKDVIRNVLGVTANKILSGQQIAGVWGNATIQSMGGAQCVSGSFYRQGSVVNVQLPFTPNFIVTVQQNSTTPYVVIRQTVFSNFQQDIFFYKSSKNWNFLTSSSITSGQPTIIINNNSFTWQAIGGNADTMSYVALRL